MVLNKQINIVFYFLYNKNKNKNNNIIIIIPTAAFRAYNLGCAYTIRLIGRNCSEAERDLVALPVRMGGVGLMNPSDSADAEYSASIRVSAPLVSKIEAQSHETPEEAEVQRLVYATRKEKDYGLREELEEVKAMLPDKTQRAVDPACEKGASN